MQITNEVNRPLLLTVAVVLLSRIPFLFSGYGSEEDAWGLILVARNIDITGIYEVSRMPGHPAQELLLAQIWNWPSWLLNLLTAIVSTAGVLFFMLALRQWGIRNVIPAGLIVAFTPVFYINSTNVMDYTWALSLVMMAMYFVTKEKFVFAGVALGLAVGFRITAGAAGIAFAVFLLSQDRPVLKIMLIAVTSFITALVCFLPAFQVYGTEFLTYYEYFPYPPFLKNVYKGTIGAWGAMGFIAVVIGVFLALVRYRSHGKNESENHSSQQNSVITELTKAEHFHQLKWIIFMCISAIALYTYSFLKIPQKSAFVIPMIPFIALTFAILLSKNQLRLIAAVLIFSCFFFGINLDDPIRGSKASPLAIKAAVGNTNIVIDPLVGMVTADFYKRQQKIEYTQSIATALKSENENTVIIAGWWQNEINYFLLNEKPGSLKLLYYADEPELIQYKNAGYQIYYLPEQDYYNDLRFGEKDFTNRIATAFPEN